MKVAVTGATGFLGRYIVDYLVRQGHTCRCWMRAGSDVSGLDTAGEVVEWCPGELGSRTDAEVLVDGVDAVVHAALHRPSSGSPPGKGSIILPVEKNVVGTLMLIEAARAAGVPRFVFISTCAVHDVILGDRRLDETHPLWPTTPHGAQKAAVEKFIHVYGLGQGYDICSLRPTGIYGLARPVQSSKWFDLVQQVKRGETVECTKGDWQVHATDVAKAIGILLTADNVAGQAYNCHDTYVTERHIARIVSELTGGGGDMIGTPCQPKPKIETGKLQALGMTFGGEALLQETVAGLVGKITNYELRITDS